MDWKNMKRSKRKNFILFFSLFSLGLIILLVYFTREQRTTFGEIWDEHIENPEEINQIRIQDQRGDESITVQLENEEDIQAFLDDDLFESALNMELIEEDQRIPRDQYEIRFEMGWDESYGMIFSDNELWTGGAFYEIPHDTYHPLVILVANYTNEALREEE